MSDRISGMNVGKAGNEIEVVGDGDGVFFGDINLGLVGGVGKYHSVGNFSELGFGKSSDALLSDITEVERGDSRSKEYRIYVVSTVGKGTKICGRIHWVVILITFHNNFAGEGGEEI